MRVLITGESGFIAQNLARSFSNSNHEVVTIDDPNVSRLSKTGEVCVYRNNAESWQWHLENLNVDLVIHNAAVVGTDVVALSPNESSLTNLTGTYNIVRACKKSKVPVLEHTCCGCHQTDRIPFLICITSRDCDVFLSALCNRLFCRHIKPTRALVKIEDQFR